MSMQTGAHALQGFLCPVSATMLLLNEGGEAEHIGMEACSWGMQMGGYTIWGAYCK